MKTVNAGIGDALALFGGRVTVQEPPPEWPIVDDKGDRSALLAAEAR